MSFKAFSRESKAKFLYKYTRAFIVYKDSFTDRVSVFLTND